MKIMRISLTTKLEIVSRKACLIFFHDKCRGKFRGQYYMIRNSALFGVGSGVVYVKLEEFS